MVERNSSRRTVALREYRNVDPGKSLENVFELQDKVAQGVAASMEPNIRAREMDRARGKRTGHVNAYDLYLRALSDSYSLTEQGLRNCELLLREALRLDRNFS